MAGDIKLTLSTKVENLENTKNEIIKKNSKAFSATQITEIESLFARLKDSLKNFNPKSNRSLDSFNASINELVDILAKGAKTISKASKEFDNLTKEIDQISGQKRAATNERTNLTKGKYDTEKKVFFDSYKKQEITDANIRYKVGNRQASNLSTLKAKVGQGAGVFASEDDYNRAKDLVAKIQTEEAETQQKLNKINQDLEVLEQQLQDKIKERNKVSNQVAPELADTYNIGNDVANVVEQQKNQNNEDRQTEQRASEAAAANAEMQSLNKNLGKQSASFGKVFKQFTLYHFALRSMKKALREAVKTVKEVDKALTEQAMVTGLTRKQTYGLLSDYQKMASRLGSTTKEVASTMTQFLRQGRSINESLKLSEAAISAAKVAGISAADSINYLTTAVNGFQLSANDAMKVSDKFAAVAASAAASYEEVAIALSKVAAQANLAGMSIDYTTALLTKGIETTREAPETIGTALKTIIARMRELGDYGETLEGDTDLNNVESQLAYIGIKLRDNNGELRSTEDVLNDLGKKWDTLNANQQAAVAKALAGTRQQSRLIAMMQDYERVIELQEISTRSAGATMAQMATYMEGLDAALNKIRVAWEDIVKAVINNEQVINFVNGIANLLEWIADLLSNQITFMVTLVSLGSVLLISLIKKHEMQKAQNRLVLSELQSKQKERMLDLQARKTALQNAKAALQKAKIQDKITKDKAKEALLDENIANDALATQIINSTEGLTLAEAQMAIDKEILATDLEIQGLKYEMLNTDIQIAQNATGISEIWGNLASVMTPIISILSIINSLQMAYAAAQMKSAAAAKVQTAAEMKKATVQGSGMAAGIISAFSSAGIPGVIAGIAIAGALLAVLLGTGLAIAAATGAFKQETSAEKAAKKINELSKDIYELNKKSQSLDNVLNKFDDLDKKVLKTNKDLEEMNSLLDSAADSLSDEEKKEYSTYETAAGKAAYLNKVQEETENQLTAKRSTQRQEILNLKNNAANWKDFLKGTSSEILQARDAIYALNNASLYQYIDELTEAKELTDEQAKATEKLTQTILEGMDAAKASDLLEDENAIKRYVNTISEVTSTYKDSEGKIVEGVAAEILNSDDYSITERVEAFREIEASLANLKDPELLKAFREVNKEWETFAGMTEEALKYIDNINASIDGINTLASAIQKLGYTTEESTDKINELFTALQDGYGLKGTIRDLFGTDNYDDILNAYDKAFGTTLLNMGQNVDKFKNTVNSLYEKSKEWAEMSETDRTSFISEHADLFKGDGGATLLKAFESGNYKQIEQALSANEALVKQREQLLKDVNEQLEIELARSAEQQNHAYIQQLKEYKRQLEDVNKVYLASLKLQYEQQQAQLEAYKSLLQQETDALTEALEKRKEAYQKYFETINAEEEALDYEEKAQTLIANISKLSSSTNADAIAKTADLTKQLEDLEKDRLKELRQQAQEAVIKGIEDEVTKISDNLEKLLTNEQALLNAMMKDSSNPSEFIASLVAAQVASGNNTELGMQTYLQQMQATFASIMPNVEWADVDVERRGDSLILNIMGKEIQLNDSEQQTIYDAIQKALKQLGYN